METQIAIGSWLVLVWLSTVVVRNLFTIVDDVRVWWVDFHTKRGVFKTTNGRDEHEAMPLRTLSRW